MRKMLLGVGGMGLVAASWLVGPALASSLGSSSRTLSARNASIGRCDADGVTTVYTLASGNISGVVVSGVASTCAGATLKVTVNNGTTTQSGTAAIPGGGGSVTVTLGSTIAMKDTTQIEMAI